ncbi:MAG: YraN family protein [Candidatus Bipolaricaulia bacterium]
MGTDLGERGEAHAAEFLRRQGYEIIARNYRWRGGEIDLIARDRNWLVFVEVKARSGDDYGLPEEAITAAKRRRLITAARAYLAGGRVERDWDIRFDVVAISGGEIRLHQGVFQLELE